MTVDDGRAVGRETPNQGGWASFEARVRERRLAGCIERAANAIDLGHSDDALEALNEARALSPLAPEIAELEDRLRAQPVARAVHVSRAVHIVPDAPQGGSASRVFGLIGATAVLLALFFVLGYGLMRFQDPDFTPQLLPQADSGSQPPATPPSPSSPAPSSAPAPSAPAPSAPAPSAPAPSAPDPSAPDATPPKAEAPSTPAPVTAQKAAPPASEKPSIVRPERPAATGTAGVSAPPTPRVEMRPPAPAAAPPSAAVVETRRVPAEPELPAATPTMPTAGLTLPTAVAGGIKPVTSIVKPAGDLHAEPASERRADETGIRSALLRYESAYNRLDAKAATAVWPRVDQRALGRAFDGLLSQRISLGLCDITVIGAVGGASCVGKARWEPKIGGGMQMADRQWNFNLRKTGDGWKIEEIRVR